MNAAPSAASAADIRERRRRRAIVALRLVSSGADALSSLDWQMLEEAPAWLALPDTKLATLQRQIGALVYAPEMALWIDGARIGAARSALGDTFWQALLAQRDLAAFPQDAGPRRPIEHAEHVGPHLQMAGAAVLLASLPQGALRRVVIAAMAPTAPAPLPAELALSLIARAQSLAVPATTPLSGSPAPVASAA